MRRGTRVGEIYVGAHVDGSDVNEEIVDAVDGAGPGIEKAGEDHGDRYGEKFSDRFRDRLDGIKERLGGALTQRLGEAGEMAGEKAGDRAGRSMVDRLSSVLSDKADGVAESFADRIGERLADRLELVLAAQTQALEESLSSVSGNRRSSLPGDGQDDRGLGDRFASLFGKGSRNNGLNLLGSTVGNLINLSEKLTDAGITVGKTFLKGFNEAGEGASVFQKILGGISETATTGLGQLSKGFSLLASSGPALLALAGAAVVLIGIMSALVSVVGALAGILTAMAATITSALVGALAVLGGALGAVAVAGGLVAIAFTSMTDAQSAQLASSFQPLKAELTGIGQLMITQIIPYFDTWSRNLQNALLLIAPLAERMGDVFGRAGNIITNAFSGPGFQALFTQLGIYLPNIVINLSRAFGDFLNGVAGVFAALLPSVDRFAGYLADVAERFSNFATSPQGQNAIVDFVNRALASLQSLWNFVRELGGLLADVLFDADSQNAGNGIFDSLADALGRARAAIDNADLEKWFTDAINFGGQLWQVMGALKDVFVALYNAGVLEAVADGLGALASFASAAAFFLEPVVNLMGILGPLATAVVTPISAAVGALASLSDELGGIFSAMSGVLGLANALGVGNGASASATGGGFVGAIGNALSGALAPAVATAQYQMPNFTLPQLQGLGNTALNQTSQANGGYLPEPTKPTQTKPKYVNPYVDYANSLMAQAPTVAQQIRQAMKQMNKAVKDTIADAATAIGGNAAKEGLSSQIDSLRDSGRSAVDSAQSALNSSAQTLANAGSKKAAKAALKQVKADQAALAAAQRQQAMLTNASNILARQTFVSGSNVAALLGGQQVNATLAEYAEAREQLIDRLEEANDRLTDAIALRDNYNTAVTDSVKAFGSILTAQAKEVNGVAQALTADDITGNLQDRLNRIVDFQTKLNVLLARGLSNDAYKQLVDAGVENGGAYVDALSEGGQGAITQVNDLTAQINQAAANLGGTAANRLYQAGVDAAQGLVDGLNSLSGELESAAARLGYTIALEIRRSLGIASPSKVLRGDMQYAGDGIVLGLDDQQVKVADAAARLASKIAISPSLATAIAEGRVPADGSTPVSGNSPIDGFRDLHVHTPTEDPVAVAREVNNEMTARL